MDLILGGRAQGKLAYAMKRNGLSPADICDGADCALDAVPRARALNRMHLLVRRLLAAESSPEEYIAAFVRQNPAAVILCDEIGCGVVPLGEEPRAWRERTGRILCTIAKQAARVERVYCGIPETIKK